MKNTLLNRILAWVLVLTTLFQMVPFPAAAAENQEFTSQESDETSFTTVVGEVQELRSEDSKHFRLSDGSYIAVSYGMPIHYQDNNGAWQDIDNSFISDVDNKDTAVYRSMNAATSVAFASNLTDGDVFTVGNEEISVSMSVLDTVQAAQLVAEKIEIKDSVSNSETQDIFAAEQPDEYPTAIPNSVAEETDFVIDRLDNLTCIENSVAESIIKDVSTSQTEQNVGPLGAQDTVAVDFSEVANTVTYSRTAIAEVEVSTQNPFRVENSNWKVEDLIPEKLQSSLLYEDVFSGTDIRYIAIGNNIKEQIIVKEPQNSYRYDFLLELKGLTSAQNTDGSITLHNAEGKKVYEIPRPYMEDSANNISYEAYYTLTDTDQGTVLTVTADADWINDPNRVFPVMIDPSLIAVSGSVQNQMYSCYVREGDNSQVQDSSVNIFSGVSSDNKRYRTFLHFSQTPVIPTGYEVVSAELALYKRFYQHENQGELAFGIYEVTTEKPSEYSTYADWLSAMTWATKPEYDTNNLLDYVRISSDAHQYLTWDMTELVQKWYETDIQNKTVAITAISEDEQIEAAEYAYAYFSSSTNAGSGTPPILIVSYRSTMGIEPYYTYATLDAGNAGTGYVADNSGQLKVVREVASYASGVNPFSLNLVYNSDHFSRSSDDYQHAQEMGLNVKLGSGWTLDVIQTIDEAEITGNSYLRYHDGDGTYHYFLKNETDGLYYDEDGLGLKIENLGSNQFEMTDDKDNLWRFDNGFLKEIIDNNRTKSADGTLSNDGNLIRINYNADNTLNNIQQINRNGAVITVASFAYNSSGYLEKITDAAGKVTTLGYTGTDMTSITRDSYVVGEYTYSGHRITQLKDTQRSYAVEIGYTSDNRVASYRETGNGANGAGAEIQYPDRGKTVYHDYGTDGTAGTGDDVYTTCLFDHAMRTVNMYSTETAVTQSDTLMSDVISASNAVYNNAGSADSETGDISKAYKKNNRIARSSSIGVASQQLMQNFGFESDTSGWTLSGVSSEGKNTNIVVKVDNPRTGNYSLKGYIQKNNTYTTGVSASRATGTLTAGMTYTLSAYVNTSQITQLKGTGLYLLVNDHNGNTWQSNCINYISSTIIDDGWVRLSVTFTAENSVNHTIGIFNDRAEGVFFADDFQLEKADGPSNVNLLENGSMTTANSGWTILDGGTFTGGGILLTGDPDNGNTKFYQDVPLNLPGTETYVVSGWAKGNAVPDNVVTGDPETDEEAYAKDAQKQFGLRAVVYYANDGGTEFHYAPFDPDVTGWQFTSLTVVPKQPGETVEKIRITGTYERNGNTARFDNFSLVREVAQTLDYDDDGNLESVATSGIQQDVSTYSGGNLISTVTGGNGTYTYDYDETFTRRLTKTTVTGTGINQSYTYDTDGNVTATTLAGSGSKTLNTSASYTNSGNLLSTVTDSSGNTTSYAYGTELSKTFGVPSSITDAKGTTMTQTVDTFGRVTNSSVANLNQIYYTYYNFRPYQIIRKDGSNVSQTYQFGYDDYGNVTSLKVGSKTLAQYAYGANNGPLSTLTYGNGDTVNYTYDQYGRLLKEIQDDGSTMTYTYNGEGMLYSATESGTGRSIRTVYTYDTLGRLIYKDFVKGTTSSLRYSAGYNNKNQLVTRGWATNGLNYQENFTYNSADGTLNTMTIDTDATTGVEHTFQLYYDDLRRLLTVGRGVYNFSYTYKDISDTQTTNQIQSLWYNGAAGNIGFHYTYDALGNIATYQEPSGTFTYTYDAQGQLTKAVKGSTTYNYSYDSVGNILTANGHTYTYGNSDWKDLLTAYDGQSISYDGSGNPTSYYNGTRWTFGWTNGRSLTSASNGSTTATYAYNLDGSRSSKTVNGVPHYYLWQDGKPIKEYVDGNSDIFDRYDTLYFLYDENGRPFALIFNGTTYYYVLNLQGDVVRLVDASGTIVAAYTYDPYGNILTATGDLAQINPLRYRGYYYDNETGLYYVSSRYYDPEIGRWINADDTAYLGADGTPLSYNLFAYCKNNPVMGYDPSGTFDWGSLAQGGGWLATGIAALAVGVSVLTCGVATPLMVGVALATAGAGALTVANGASEIGEAFTGYNVMRDGVFQGNATAYNAYAYSTATVAQVGTAICGGWSAKNAPRIEAYNNIQNYKYADSAAKHIGQRSYYDSTLLQKQIIKYGSMTSEGNGVYTFRVAGSSFNVARQLMHQGTWELTTINSMKLIGHFLLDY